MGESATSLATLKERITSPVPSPPTVMILLIGWLTVPWFGPCSILQCLAIGALWLALMLTFELGLGHWVFRFSWRRLTADFDLRKGGLLSLGMAVLFFTPLIIAKLRGLI